MIRSMFADHTRSVEKEKYEDKTSAQRPGKDEDMAGAVLFTVTNQYLNGKTVTVDGGYELVAGT
jgi:NAD(P)-dependent dehydrogenase (short-subunit alcohol dehydrogenase family)